MVQCFSSLSRAPLACIQKSYRVVLLHGRLVDECEREWNNTNDADQYRLGRALLSFADTGSAELGTLVHARLLKSPPQWSAPFSLWNKLLNVYYRSWWVPEVRRLFDEMVVRNAATYNTILSVCLRGAKSDGHDVAEAISFYKRMLLDKIIPNRISLLLLLNAFQIGGLSLSSIKQMHCHAFKFLSGPGTLVGGSLINAYVKCGQLDLAIRVFEEIEELDTVCCNIMINACASHGCREYALRIFHQMQQEGSEGIPRLDYFTLTSVMKACLHPEDLHLGIQLHSFALKTGFHAHLPVKNALLHMYSKCDDRTKSAFDIFLEIENPSIISWTTMIAGFGRIGTRAFNLYIDMLRSGLSENQFNFLGILDAASNLASILHGRQVHARIVKSPFGSDIWVQNALMDTYFKCGSEKDARLVLDTMEKHDKVSWAVMISGYGRHGRGLEAVQVFKEMSTKGFKPDALVCLSVLTACSYAGLIDEGLWIFHSMNVLDVSPTRKHYYCVVNLLGRAGRMDEAERFIKDMGLEKDSLAWESLLGICEMHEEMELGKIYAERIIELRPEEDGPYISLSNMFAATGMWDKKFETRKKLGDIGLQKRMGCSIPIEV